jgi:hypothetical protein
MEARKILNRDIEHLRAKLPTIPDGAPEQEISISDLISSLGAANDANAERSRRLAAQASAYDQAKRLAEESAELRKQAELTMIRAVRAREEAIAIIIPEAVDTTQLKADVASAESRNAAHRVLKQHKELTAQIAEKQFNLTGREGAIASNRALRHRALAEAKYPVEGLSFGDGEILYNGIPFAQLATGEQIRISLAIAMEANPEIRVIRIKEGALLDEGNLALIEMMAAEKDFQVWVEKVDTSGTVGIVIEDGSVVPLAE